MSQISAAIFGAMAVSLTVGAVQFASGHDLAGALSTGLGAGLGAGLGTPVAATAETGINRAAKADRAAAAIARSGGPMRTIAIRLDSLADTSVVIRIPVTAESRNVPPGPVLTKPDDRKLTACEPVVSILTEVAKLLRPARCVT